MVVKTEPARILNLVKSQEGITGQFDSCSSEIGALTNFSRILLSFPLSSTL